MDYYSLVSVVFNSLLILVLGFTNNYMNNRHVTFTGQVFTKQKLQLV